MKGGERERERERGWNEWRRGRKEGKRERPRDGWKGTKRGEKGKNGLGLVRGDGAATHRLSAVGPAQSRPITSMGYLRLMAEWTADWLMVRIGMH